MNRALSKSEQLYFLGNARKPLAADADPVFGVECDDLLGHQSVHAGRLGQRLEDDGFIRGYRAVLDRDKLGFSLVSVISVTLSTHNRDNARRFGELLSRLPEVQEAHALTGEMDYIVKVVTPDLKSLSEFVNGVLLPHESVQHVKTAIVLETLKETGALPI